jgi:PhnB protein
MESQMNIAPQLAFAGQCRQAFEFYTQLLGGKIVVMNPFGGNEDRALPPGSTAGEADQIRFAEIRIGGSVLRGNDIPKDQFTPMRGFNVSLHIEKAADARRIFDALSEGGKVSTPLSKVDWAAQFGMVTDRFGVPWLILGLEK